MVIKVPDGAISSCAPILENSSSLGLNLFRTTSYMPTLPNAARGVLFARRAGHMCIACIVWMARPGIICWIYGRVDLYELYQECAL
jgi:hypothetical protein